MANGLLRVHGRTMTSEGGMPVEIVARMLHELQIPVATILTVGENIRDGLLDGDRVREDGATIVAQAIRLRNLWDQILLYASTGKRGLRRDIRMLTVGEVIDRAADGVSVLLQRGGFTLQREIQKGLPLLRGDLQLLSQCLENLISNAMKYSGHSRWVGVSAMLAKSSAHDGQEVRISVSDHGLGIRADDLPYIFEPFYRSRLPDVSKIRGSGLGLSIAKGCAEACGGTLSVVTQEGEGSTFTLHLSSGASPQRTN